MLLFIVVSVDLNYLSPFSKTNLTFAHAPPVFEKVPTWHSKDYRLLVLLNLLLQRPACEWALCCRAGLPPTLPYTCLL